MKGRTMRRLFIFFLGLCSSCPIIPAFAQYNETLTIVSYYPSPNGVYQSLRLHPGNQPTTGVDRGTMYYNNTQDTPQYFDGTKWNNFISECGVVTISVGETFKTVNFRKTYTSSPIVIPTISQKGNPSDLSVSVFIRDLTSTYVQFDIDAVDADGNLADEASAVTEVQYIVIPR
jgi:hypothetical protein